jgi:hypothetical protein
VRGFVANLETKPMFRRGPKFAGFAENAVGLPKILPDVRASSTDCLCGRGRGLDGRKPRTVAWLANTPTRGRNNIATRREFGWTLAQVNHYSVRTPDFFLLKASRGRGAVSTGPRRPNVRHTQGYFDRFDRNEAEDRSILHWQGAVTEEIERLLQIPAVLAAVRYSSGMVREHMSKVESETAAESADTENTPQEETATPAFKLTFPAAETAFVKAAYPKAKVILEYGSGGSTVLAAESGCRVISVESDKAWAARLTEHLATISDTAKVHHADIGRTGAWGVPMKANEYPKFHAYALSVWDRPDFEEPDLVLIDGRFRASCLVAVLLRAKRPTTVLFDDYAKRKYYHGVEKLARKEEMIGRMARFTVTPGSIPAEMVTDAIGWFTDQR